MLFAYGIYVRNCLIAGLRGPFFMSLLQILPRNFLRFLCVACKVAICWHHLYGRSQQRSEHQKGAVGGSLLNSEGNKSTEFSHFVVSGPNSLLKSGILS